MPEVIAQKKSALIGLYFFCIALGIALTVIGIIYLEKTEEVLTEVIILICGAVVLLGGLFNTLRVLIVPKNIIVYENGELRCRKTVFTPADIVNVEYKHARGRGVNYNWGKLKVVLANMTLSFDFVADVEQAYERLIQLMQESKGNE